MATTHQAFYMNKEQGIEVIRQVAEQGDAWMQSFLGDCYYEGQGVEQDYSQAVYWYRKAAEQGVAEAQCNVGVAITMDKV